jgi:hypothetical protein
MAIIYANTSVVIVWLGEAQDDSDESLESMCQAGERSQGIQTHKCSREQLSSLELWIPSQIS